MDLPDYMQEFQLPITREAMKKHLQMSSDICSFAGDRVPMSCNLFTFFFLLSGVIFLPLICLFESAVQKYFFFFK